MTVTWIDRNGESYDDHLVEKIRDRLDIGEVWLYRFDRPNTPHILRTAASKVKNGSPVVAIEIRFNKEGK